MDGGRAPVSGGLNFHVMLQYAPAVEHANMTEVHGSFWAGRGREGSDRCEKLHLALSM